MLGWGLFTPRLLVLRGNRSDSEPGCTCSHARPVSLFWARRASLISEITAFRVKQGGSHREEWRKDTKISVILSKSIGKIDVLM